MNIIATSFTCILMLGGATAATAQTQPAPSTHAHDSQPAAAALQLEIAVAAEPAVAVVERFGQALIAGDMKTVQSLLDGDVLILETGGAERSREE